MWKQCEALQADIVSFRRALHQIPELGHDLPRTQAYLRQQLDSMGVSYTLSPVDSSLWGEIEGGKPGKTVLLRADTDALPIQEQTGLSCSSQIDGMMHACGHDAHAAMLLGALQVLQTNREHLSGKVRFVFQAAEECVSGAQKVVEQGVCNGVDAVFGCHIGNLIDPTIPSGTFTVCPGNVMASADCFFLTVQGKGCHGSTPEKGIDPVTIASHIVINLQEVLARELPAAQAVSLTVGRIQGGQIYNIIPEQVEIDGTLRAHDPATREYVLQRIEEIAKATAALFRGSCHVRIRRATDAVINPPQLTALAQQAIEKVAGEGFLQTSMTPSMGSEDFSCYQKEVPGVFYFLSSAADERTRIPHHNPRFDIDESVLWKGSAALVALAEDFLKA